MDQTEIRRPLVWLALPLLALLALAPYLGALSHPLLHDDRTLFDNAWLQQEAGLSSVFAHEYWHGTRHANSDLYRPVTILSFAWNLDAIPGRSGLRSVNLALHALVCLLACWSLSGALNAFPADRSGSRASNGIVAWTGAALFAAHPLASEAVLFLVGRAELLAAALGLAAFGLLVRAAPRWTEPRLWLSAALLFLALGSKESAAAWLPILLLWSLLSRSSAWRGLAVWSAALVAFVLLRAGVVGWLPHGPPWVDNPLVGHDAATRVANAVLAHLRYLGKMVWPASLSVDHGHAQTPVVALFPWGLAAAATVTAAWLAVAWFLRRVSASALFLWVMVPAAFAVTGNVLFPIGTIFAERLAYLPLLAACVLAAHLALRLPAPRAVPIAILCVVVAAAGVRTVRRAQDLRNHDALVLATVQASPRAVKALLNVARMELREGRIAEAIRDLERATSLWPDYPRALALLADAHERAGDPALAEEYRRRAREAYRQLSVDR